MTQWPIDWRVVVDEAIRRRKREKLSQRALADLAGVSAPTVNAFEQGEINLRLAGVAAILQALGMFVQADQVDSLDTFIYNARRRWEELVAPLPENYPGRQTLGHSEQAYALGGLQADMSPQHLRRLLAEIPKSSGWTPFWVPTRQDLRPYIEEGMVECWLGRPEQEHAFSDPAHTDFWRVGREGFAYLHRGYQEDGPGNLEPGTIFDASHPIWRTAEVLLHAANLAKAMGGSNRTEIKFRARYSGLEGRELTSWSKRRLPVVVDGRYRSRTSVIDLEINTYVAEIESNLEVVVKTVLNHLYERFDGYELSADLVHSEIQDMRRQPGFGQLSF